MKTCRNLCESVQFCCAICGYMCTHALSGSPTTPPTCFPYPFLLPFPPPVPCSLSLLPIEVPVQHSPFPCPLMIVLGVLLSFLAPFFTWGRLVCICCGCWWVSRTWDMLRGGDGGQRDMVDKGWCLLSDTLSMREQSSHHKLGVYPCACTSTKLNMLSVSLSLDTIESVTPVKGR